MANKIKKSEENKNYIQIVISVLFLAFGILAGVFSFSTAYGNDKQDSPNVEPPAKIFAACIILAAEEYAIPPPILLGIYDADGGAIGESYTERGITSYGVMKVPETYIKEISSSLNVDKEDVINQLIQDPCFGTSMTAWKIRGYLNKTDSISKSLEMLGQDRGYSGDTFKKLVSKKMMDSGLIKSPRPQQEVNKGVGILANVWHLVISLPNGFTVERNVEGLAMCGLKSKQIHYEMMIEERFASGNWYCKNVGTGKKVTGKEYFSNKRYQDPFDNEP